MKKICIATLSSRDRVKFLKITIESFVERTILNEKIDWYIFSNGSSEITVSYIKELVLNQPYEKINFIASFSEENLGLGRGVNFLNNLIKDKYEYVYFLEDDWITLSFDLSGKDENWFNTTIDFLDENKNVTYVILRRYSSEMEMRCYSYAQIIDGIKETKNYKNCIYAKSKSAYVNNPHIRRDKIFWDDGIFPHFEPENETKDNRINWCQSEIDANRRASGCGLETWYMLLGPIQHIEDIENRDLDSTIRKGCGLYGEIPGQRNSCKYGFIFHLGRWCGSCIKEEDITKISTHENRFIKMLEINRNIHINKTISEEEGQKSLEKIMYDFGTPTIDGWKELVKNDI